MMANQLFDFDSPDDWFQSLHTILSDLVPTAAFEALSQLQDDETRTALDILIDHCDRHAIVARVENWLTAHTVVGAHGSRMTEDEVASVLSIGLLALRNDRRESLRARLAHHPYWPSRAQAFDQVYDRIANGGAGNRMGQVHLTISAAGMMANFNHYLVEGSEFDSHVAQLLLNGRAKQWLKSDRNPVLFKIGVPGRQALNAANPWTVGEIPNLIREILDFYAEKFASLNNIPVRSFVDCGMIFRDDLPPEWVISHEILDEKELMGRYRP